MSSDTIAQIAYLSILLIALLGWVMAEYRGRMGFALRSALAWGMIFLAVAAGYGLWGNLQDDFRQTVSTTEDGVVQVPRRDDGHFYLTLTVNGSEMEFLADTGASGVVLTQADAGRVGIDASGLRFDDTAMTANGAVRTARIRLDAVALGPHQDRDLPAWVNEGDLDVSLLGMDYLSRYRIEIDGARMILTRRQ
jgi:aspartyl protease family protein